MTTFTAYAALQPKEKLQLWQYEPAPLKDNEIEVKVTHNGLYFYQWGSSAAKKITGSLDLLLSTSSAELDWDLAFSLLANNGVLCFLGIPVSSINVPLIPSIFGQKSVVGSVVGGRRYMREMLDFAAVNQIKPMIETMPLNKINEAMDKVLAGKVRYRIVLVSETNN